MAGKGQHGQRRQLARRWRHGRQACRVLATPAPDPDRRFEVLERDLAAVGQLQVDLTPDLRALGSTALANLTSAASLIILTMRPWCAVTAGLNRPAQTARSIASVPASSAPIRRE
jgi:hypothetical protein